VQLPVSASSAPLHCPLPQLHASYLSGTVTCSFKQQTIFSSKCRWEYINVQRVGFYSYIKISYYTQLTKYTTGTYWQRFDLRWISCWPITTQRSTWPGNHLVPCVAELVGSCVAIHTYWGFPDPKCLFDPSDLSLCLPIDHFCFVTINDMVLGCRILPTHFFFFSYACH